MQRGFISVTAALALAGALAASAASVWMTRIYYLGQIAAMKLEAKTDADGANRQANMAALRHEEWKMAQKPRVVTITKEIDRALETDRSWAAVPVPDGVRVLLDQARAATGAAESDGAVPAVSRPGDQDERRTGEGLRVGPGLGLRLPGASQGAR